MRPAPEYRQRLEARRRTHATLTALDERLGYARLAVFGVAAVVAWFSLWRHAFTPWFLVLPAVAFGWLMRRHDRVIRGRDAAARAVAFYERGLARIEDRWIGTGEPGDRFRDDTHLYANDLDLFGPGSLFELLSIARTRAGEETLAAWMKAPAPPETIHLRQAAIDDLTPRLDLREELSLAGTDVRAGVDTKALQAWAAAPPALGAYWPWIVATVFTGSIVVAAFLYAVYRNPAPIITVAVIQIVCWFPFRNRIQSVLHAVGQPAHDLDILAHLLERLERESFNVGRLAVLRSSLSTVGVPASIAIRRIHRLSELHDWQHNQFFAPFAALLLWGTHVAFAIEAWRRQYGAHVAVWLATVGEFEALSSISAYRYEHPEDVFPEVASGGSAVYEGERLGHPLLPASRTVPNGVRLTGDVRLLVVSGSNMSGKSTLLRTVGINAVLALMGAPVRAGRLRLTPLAVGATLRIQDSLQEGRSRFYAEITRIRQLADLARGPLPLLFLLDELFHGTNSHDRLVGASGVLRSFLDRGAIGLITTHDLALTGVADALAPRAVNVHFEDRFEEGEIRFDYQMRAGPVTRSNAIALMKAVGLEVDEP